MTEAATAAVDSARAWRAVVAGFLSMFTVFGVAYSFGAFFEPMAAEFGTGRGATSLVFSITAFLYFVLGALSGPAVDRFGPRPVLLAGAAVMGAGLLLTATVQSIWVGYATYGVGVGVGVACAYQPMLAVIGGWFERRRSAALGVAVAGIGLGTVIVAPLAARLIERYGWRTTYAIFGVAAAALLVLAAARAERPPQPTVARHPVRLRDSIRTRAFVCLYASVLLLSLGLFQVFVYVVDFAQTIGIGRVAGATLVSIVGAASVVGRLALGIIADRVGRLATYRSCFLVMGLSFGIWLTASSYGALVAFALVLGTAYGGFITLSPAVAAEVFGVTGLGGLIGVLYTGAGVGSLFGPPLAGLLIDATGGYRWAIAASGLVAMASWAVLLLLRQPRRAPAR
ncbi:MAG: MFS transporter [Nitriliruptorales bacterium]|nr:MFS transporter [Nitriliruptorales bacterium]